MSVRRGLHRLRHDAGVLLQRLRLHVAERPHPLDVVALGEQALGFVGVHLLLARARQQPLELEARLAGQVRVGAPHLPEGESGVGGEREQIRLLAPPRRGLGRLLHVPIHPLGRGGPRHLGPDHRLPRRPWRVDEALRRDPIDRPARHDQFRIAGRRLEHRLQPCPHDRRAIERRGRDRAPETLRRDEAQLSLIHI